MVLLCLYFLLLHVDLLLSFNGVLLKSESESSSESLESELLAELLESVVSLFAASASFATSPGQMEMLSKLEPIQNTIK